MLHGFMRVNWPLEGPKVERVHRVALVVEMGLTRSHFPGGKLEVSHLCHEKICVNPVHLVLEPNSRNLERLLQAPGYMLSVTPPPLHF